jgi:hypothetical protein
MTLRRLTALLIVAFPAAGTVHAATFRTANFVVTAPNQNLAQRFGEAAEKFRQEKAMQWLGQEMPQWPQPCPLVIRINEHAAGGGGATSFTFGHDGRRSVVTSQEMEIHGPLNQLLNSVLPHEVTHTVLAHHFGRPVPRWADEGGSVLSENDEERFNHDVKNREYLNQGRGITLKILFPMAEYPADMHVLYAQGYSVCAYLVEQGGGGQVGRAKLLQFLEIGMQGGSNKSHGTVATWNAAVRQVYRIDSVDALEAAWLDDLRNPKQRVAVRAPAARNVGATPTAAARTPSYVSSGGARPDIRSSAAPALPILDPPVIARGTSPENDPPRPTSPARPDYLPPSAPLARPTPAPTPPTYPSPEIPLLLPAQLPPSNNR